MDKLTCMLACRQTQLRTTKFQGHFATFCDSYPYQQKSSVAGSLQCTKPSSSTDCVKQPLSFDTSLISFLIWTYQSSFLLHSAISSQNRTLNIAAATVLNICTSSTDFHWNCLIINNEIASTAIIHHFYKRL